MSPILSDVATDVRSKIYKLRMSEVTLIYITAVLLVPNQSVTNSLKIDGTVVDLDDKFIDAKVTA